MKKADIYEISLRILGIYLFVTAFLSTMTMLVMTADFSVQAGKQGMENTADWGMSVVISVVNVLINLAFALFIFLKAKMIVRKICKAEDFEENFQLFAEPVVIYEIAILITGFILVAWTLPDFIVKLRAYIQAEKTAGWHAAYDTSSVWTLAIKTIVGLFAIVSARPLANRFVKPKSGK